MGKKISWHFWIRWN